MGGIMLDNLFERPKRFSEILDLTFQLSRKHFASFMKILLIIIGPFILIEAAISLFSGVNFFRGIGEGVTFLERFVNTITEEEFLLQGNELWNTIFLFITVLFYPFAMAAILYAVNNIRKGETYSIGDVIKRAFSRFFPLLGSNILFFLILLGMLVFLIFVLFMIFSVIFTVLSEFVGFWLTFILIIAFYFIIAFFVTRLSFYLGVVVIDDIKPGFGRSWRLTKQRWLPLLGIYFVLSIITSIINSMAQLTFVAFLGYSVLYLLLENLIILFTWMIISVAYAVVFFDLKVRHDGDDLIEMIDSLDR